MSEEELYNRFAQYYMEMTDTLHELTAEAEELLSEDKVVPEKISSEIFRHQVIVDILTQGGQEMYNKAPKQLYMDGYTFWIEETDKINQLRERG